MRTLIEAYPSAGCAQAGTHSIGVVYDSEDANTYCTSAKLSLAVNQADSLEFTLAPQHAMYANKDKIAMYRQFLAVRIGGVLKSICRVTSMKQLFNGCLTYYCEGGLAWLKDWIYYQDLGTRTAQTGADPDGTFHTSDGYLISNKDTITQMPLDQFDPMYDTPFNQYFRDSTGIVISTWTPEEFLHPGGALDICAPAVNKWWGESGTSARWEGGSYPDCTPTVVPLFAFFRGDANDADVTIESNICTYYDVIQRFVTAGYNVVVTSYDEGIDNVHPTNGRARMRVSVMANGYKTVAKHQVDWGDTLISYERNFSCINPYTNIYPVCEPSDSSDKVDAGTERWRVQYKMRIASQEDDTAPDGEAPEFRGLDTGMRTAASSDIYPARNAIVLNNSIDSYPGLVESDPGKGHETASAMTNNYATQETVTATVGVDTSAWNVGDTVYIHDERFETDNANGDIVVLPIVQMDYDQMQPSQTSVGLAERAIYHRDGFVAQSVKQRQAFWSSPLVRFGG